MTGTLPIAIEVRLRGAGLRPTRQRVALGDLLFAKGDRHLTVEELHAFRAGIRSGNLPRQSNNIPAAGFPKRSIGREIG